MFFSRILLLVWVGLAPGIAASMADVQREVEPNPALEAVPLKAGSTTLFVPDGPGWREMAVRIQKELARRGCPGARVVSAGQMVTNEGLDISPRLMPKAGESPCHIVLGFMGNNVLSRWLYIHFRTCLDADYLDDGGWAVQVLADTWAPGAQAVLLQGMTPEAVGKAAQRFCAQITSPADSPAVPIGFEFTPGPAKRTKVDTLIRSVDNFEANFASMYERSSPQFRGVVAGRTDTDYWLTDCMQSLGDLGILWSVTGDARCPQIAVRIVGQIKETLAHYQPSPEKMGDLDYSLLPMCRGLNLLLDGPSIRGEDRRFILDLLAWLAPLAAPKAEDNENAKRGRFAVNSRHAIAMFDSIAELARVLRLRARLSGETAQVVDRILQLNDRFFSVMIRSYCDSFDHVWTFDATGMIQQYALEKPVPSYLRDGSLRLGADAVAMLLRPNGRLTVWGGETIQPNEDFKAWPVMGRAETMLGGGEYQWLHDRHVPDASRQKTFIYGTPAGVHLYNPGHPPVEPARLDGLCSVPLNPALTEDISDGVFSLWNDLRDPGALDGRAFYKLSYRSDWSQDAQYFVFNGMGGYSYGTSGMAGLLTYDQFGRQLLCSLQPFYSERHQNGIMITRAGLAERSVPYLAALEAVWEGPSGGYARLKLSNANGTDWTRHLFWQKNRFLLVWDEITALVEDDYFLTCGWRSPLDRAGLDPHGNFLAKGDGVALKIQPVDLPGQSPRESFLAHENPNAFPYLTNELIYSFQQETAVHLVPGQTRSFVNLIAASRGSDNPDYEAHVVNDHTLEVVQGAQSWDFGMGDSAEFGGASATVFQGKAWMRGEGVWCGFDLTKAVVGGKSILEARLPIHLALATGAPPTAMSVAYKRETVKTLPVERKELTSASTSMGGDVIKCDLTALNRLLAWQPDRNPPPTPAPPVAIPAAPGFKITPWSLGPPETARATHWTAWDQGGDYLLAVATEDEAVRVFDREGKVRLRLNVPSTVTALGWHQPQKGVGPPNLLVAQTAEPHGNMLQSFDLDGKSLWGAALINHTMGSARAKIFSLAAYDRAGDGHMAIIAGSDTLVAVYDPQGKWIENLRPDMMPVMKLMPLPAVPSEPQSVWMTPYRSPFDVLNKHGALLLTPGAWYNKESGWPYDFLLQGLAPNGNCRLAAAYGPYVASAEFNIPSGGWVADSMWKRHLTGDVRALCPAGPSFDDGFWCAGDFGFLDRFSPRGGRLARLPFPWRVHQLKRMKDGRILAATEERGLLVLDAHGRVIGRIADAGEAPILGVVPIPSVAGGAEQWALIPDRGNIEILRVE